MFVKIRTLNTPSPFQDRKHYLRRPADAQFASVMEADRAHIRMVGPRLIGKTSLVTHYARETNSPILTITLHPSVNSPACLIEKQLGVALKALARESPKLHKALERLLPDPTKRRYEAAASQPIPGLDQLAVGGAMKYEAEPLASGPAVSTDADALARTSETLRALGHAAAKLKCRPIVFFDEIQEAIVRDTPSNQPGREAVWAIRNEAQHHTTCRFVFAGSNQRLFDSLATASGPLLNFGASISIPPLKPDDVDAWAIPHFRRAGVHVRSFGVLCQVLCGKIGDLVAVLSQLWRETKRNDLLDGPVQGGALRTVAAGRVLPEMDDVFRQLSPRQASLLRWLFTHPGASPYTRAGLAEHGIVPGSVRTALAGLIAKGLIEDFDGRVLIAAPLRIMNLLR